MKFLFKYPTLGRPDWFMKTLEKYYSMLSGNYKYEFIVSLNSNDATMNNASMKRFMDIQMSLRYFYENHKTKIDACNANLEGRDFDILFLISDDMIPIVPGFDVIIAEEMEKHFPNMDGALHFPDGYNNTSEDSAITLTIMGKKLYDRIGYIYHPDYKSFYCDNEFRDVVYGMNKAVFIPKVIVKHEWRGPNHNKPDEVYRQNSKMGGGGIDEQIYNRRKKAGFPK